jgi:signal transduction histidine kinase
MLSILAILPIIGVLPMAAFAVALLSMQWQARQDETRHEVQQTVRTLAVAVDREIAGSIRQLERIADIPSLTPETMHRFHEYMRLLADEQSEWDNLILADPDGRQVLNAAVRPGAPLPAADPLPYAQVVQSGRPQATDVYTSSLTGEPSVSVLVPVRRDEEVRWVLAARLSTKRLSELLSEPLLQPGVVSAVLDRHGRYVARSRGYEQMRGRSAPARLVELLGSSTQGVERMTGADGDELKMAWEQLDIGWFVANGSPVALYDVPLRRSMMLAGSAGAALLLIGLAVAFLLSRRLSVAVDDAARDAGKLADQQPVGLRRSHVRELDRLFDAQHRASARLAQVESERGRAMEGFRGALQRRDEFLAMLAHELRNPLAPLTNALHLIRRGDALPDRDRPMLAMAERQTRQLARLVDDLLEASRLATGKIRLRREPTSLSAAVREAAEAFRHEVESASQRLVVDLPEQPVETVADRARISQVLHNLLGNAVKFGRAGGTIRLALQAAGDTATITVSDDGLGIDRARLGELFEPFSQIDPELDRSHGGLGLGLALVRQLVEMHGGSVGADSDGRGCGTTFTIRLPIGTPADEVGVAVREEDPGGAPSPRSASIGR